MQAARLAAPRPPRSIGENMAAETNIAVRDVGNVAWQRAGEWVLASADLHDCSEMGNHVPSGSILAAVNNQRVIQWSYREKMELLSSIANEPTTRLAFIPAPLPMAHGNMTSDMPDNTARVGGLGSPHKLVTEVAARDCDNTGKDGQQYTSAPDHVRNTSVQLYVADRMREFNSHGGSKRDDVSDRGNASTTAQSKYALLSQIQAVLKSMGMTEGTDALVSPAGIARLRADLRSTNNRNHALRRAVLGLQYAIAHDPAGTPARRGGGQIGVLGAIALSRWKAEVGGDVELHKDSQSTADMPQDPRMAQFGRLLGLLRSKPAVLAALGALLPSDQTARFAQFLTHGVFDRTSVDASCIVAVVAHSIVHSEAAARSLFADTIRTAPAVDAHRGGPETFRDQLLSSFSRRDDCKQFVHGLLAQWARGDWVVPPANATYAASQHAEEELLARAVSSMVSLLASTAFDEFPRPILAVCRLLERSCCGFSACDFLVQHVLLSALADEAALAAFDALPLLPSQFEPFAELLVSSLLPVFAARCTAKLHQRALLANAVCEFRAFEARLRAHCRRHCPSFVPRPREMTLLVAVSRLDLHMLHVGLAQHLDVIGIVVGGVPDDLTELLLALGAPRPLSHRETDNPIEVFNLDAAADTAAGAAAGPMNTPCLTLARYEEIQTVLHTAQSTVADVFGAAHALDGAVACGASVKSLSDLLSKLHATAPDVARLTELPKLLQDEAALLGQCLHQELVVQQELLVHQLGSQPGAATAVGSHDQSMRHWAREVARATHRTQAVESSFFWSWQEVRSHTADVDDGQGRAENGPSHHVQAGDDEAADCTLPPNPLAALLTTCFN